MNGSSTTGGLISGDTFASVVQAAITSGTGRSADISIISTNVADGSTAIVTADSTITVTYDADTAELY